MKYRVILHSRAKNDIVNATQWISEHNVSAALRWYQGLVATLRTLAQDPQRFAIAPESEEHPIVLRQCLYGKRPGVFRILYSIRRDRIHVWTIRHASRDRLSFDDLLSEGP